MSTDVKKQTSFAAGETPTRAAFAAAVLSISGVVPATNATDQAQIVSGLASTAYPVGSTRPLTTTRGDAPALHQVEVSRDGTVFVPQSGVLHFASDSARDTWTTSNSSLLVAGDRCVSASVEFAWNGTVWVWSGVGGAHWVARRTTAYTLTVGDLAWDNTLLEGALAGWSTSDWTTFTCTVPGVWALTAACAVATTAATYAGVKFMKNGSDLALYPWVSSTTAVTAGVVSGAFRFTVGDTLKVNLSGGSAIAGQTAANQTRFHVDFVRG